MPTPIVPRRRAALLGLALCLLAGCAGSGWRQWVGEGWQDRVVTGAPFRHRLLFKPGRGDELHIYLAGDGRIWRTPTEVFAAPQSPEPLALQLMRRDPAPALLLGRPCYLDVDDARCEPRWWTAARYSETVVTSLAAAAQPVAHRYPRVVLIGYSGGGALAVLLAPRLPQVRAVVTLAGNLDTDAWAQYHHYSRAAVIGASLNPAAQPPLPPGIAQWHYAGGRDDNVLWQWVAAFSARQDGAHFQLRKDFDHHCCWLQQWPALLTQNSTR